MKKDKVLTIGWLYPELMNVYGDRGNILVLKKRSEWRGIKVMIENLDVGFDVNKLKSCDLLMMGGAQDKQQTIVNKDLKRIKKALSAKIEHGTPGLFVCGGFQFLGKYYKEADGSIVDGLGIFDLYTESYKHKERLIGDIVVKPLIESVDGLIVGFENHGGRTFLGKDISPLGKVIKGHGNNDDGFEGAVYKNSIGTYMHGPILPKNPQIADFLIKRAIGENNLPPLDDSMENTARDFVISSLKI